MGKIIYEPKGKALEYAKFAFSAFVGCSCQCHYCYLRKGRGAAILGGDKPQLKKCFKDEEHALQLFKKEMLANLDELRKHGLFFSFTTDPMLPKTIELTKYAISLCLFNGISVKTLTKVANIDSWFIDNVFIHAHNQYIAFGFTLTGHDELETGASTNAERIDAIRKLHFAGFKTWASIEPIIDFESSYKMILDSFIHCDLYKIGLESGKKYSKLELVDFVRNVIRLCEFNKVYFKDSLLKAAGINRADLPENCIGRDFNMFKL